MKPIERILVPIDFSAGSSAALPMAEGLGGTIDLIHVWDPPAFVSTEVMLGTTDSHGALSKLEEERTRLELEELAQEARERGVAIGTAEVLKGDVAKAICAYAEKGGYDVIVMGTAGRSGLAHLLLGSVAEKVVRHSSVPVLTVRESPTSQASETAPQKNT
jgi:nucleotide-binding universal stress UspA family protein